MESPLIMIYKVINELFLAKISARNYKPAHSTAGWLGYCIHRLSSCWSNINSESK